MLLLLSFQIGLILGFESDKIYLRFCIAFKLRKTQFALSTAQFLEHKIFELVLTDSIITTFKLFLSASFDLYRRSAHFFGDTLAVNL